MVFQGDKRIDFVLVWEAKGNDKKFHMKQLARNTFEENLKNEGLELDHDFQVFQLMCMIEELHYVNDIHYYYVSFIITIIILFIYYYISSLNIHRCVGFEVLISC